MLALFAALTTAPAQETNDTTIRPTVPTVMPSFGPTAAETIQPDVIFFPPNPPPLGVPLRRPTAEPPRGLAAPATLRPFVMELFYPALSSYLFRPETGRGRAADGPRLNQKQQSLLDGYRDLREALLAELRQKIRALDGAAPGARHQELAAFAQVQAERLEHLEDTAEELRASLVRGVSWYEHRQWKLGRGPLDKPRDENRVLEAQLLRAAAYYQEGLVPAQRRLLREMAMEMEESIYAAGDPVPLDRYFLFFSPETSRFLLPSRLEPALAGRIDEYRDRKRAVKQKLRDAVYDLDGVVFKATRRHSLAQLAVEQTGDFAELERMADAIRGELVGTPGLFRMRRPVPLPEALTRRIAAYQRDRDELDRRRRARGNAASREIPRGGGRATPEERAAARGRQQEAIAIAEEKFDREVVAERRALDERLQTLIQDIADAMKLTKVRASDSFLEEYLDARRVATAYHEYSFAVMEPGLSPAQRRLLFGGAVEDLELPLPGPELQPIFAPGTIIR